jgi:uncharacterized membrane protein YccF (DUF307 family)
MSLQTVPPDAIDNRANRAEDAQALEADARLRDDIRLLGRILGDTVRDQEGAELFDLVERIRQTSIRFRRDEDEAARRELEATLNGLSHDETLRIIRAFSYFSHLANIAVYTLLPFGSRAVNRYEVTGTSDIGTGPLGVIGNIIWFVLAGWWLALGHALTALVLAITIIGIPFAWAHLKLAGIALWPIGKVIVPA